jgi:hypothetical protein
MRVACLESIDAIGDEAAQDLGCSRLIDIRA